MDLGFLIDILSTTLLVLYGLLGQNVFLAIVAFTVLVRMMLLPLTLRQQQSMKAMQELSPKLKKLQEKYKDDREQLAQEQIKLYREHKVNPFASCLPLIIQLPIIFSLWRTIIAVLASNPRQLVELQDRMLIDGLDHLIPLDNTFLWLNLSLPDPYFVLPVLVGVTTFLQQKMIMPIPPKSAPRKPGQPPDPAEQAQQMTRQMTTFMPLFLFVVSLSYSSGLSIYFVVSNVFGIVQYSLMGKADIRRVFGIEPDKDKNKATDALALEDEDGEATGEDSENAEIAPSKEERIVATAAAAVAGGGSISNGRQLRDGVAVMTLKPRPPGNKSSKKASSGGNKGSSKSSNKSRSSSARNSSSRSRQKSKKR